MKTSTPRDSRHRYQINAWGAGLFDIDDDGHVIFRCDRGTIDLEGLVQDCRLRGLQLPLLIRFPDAVRARVDALVGAFRTAIAEQGYRGLHRGVYPIKVNHQRHIVEDVMAAGAPYHYGLECGSKPELMVALALVTDPEALIIINGFKDRELIEMAVAGRQLGRRTIVVIEQLNELDLLLDAARPGLQLEIGVRVKLAARGAGRWRASSGERAKFGLSMGQLVTLVERLEAHGALNLLTLVHFHIGSQVTAISALEDSVREGARIYAELSRAGAPLRLLDVGGGLGVDYDGSRTDFGSSANYDLAEYASVVVSTIHRVLDDADVPHPDIVTESGRYIVAPSTVLVTSVLGATARDAGASGLEVGNTSDAEFPAAQRLLEARAKLTHRDSLRAYHDAVAQREDTLVRFLTGRVGLRERAAVERAFIALCQRIVALAREDEPLHEELEHLPATLADVYFCNFSVFQSLPDAWAVSQLFPIVPLARHRERPTRHAILADLTCDSDGKIDRFIDQRDVRRTLDVHALDGAPYHLGFFLLGAYQESLGDLHNLFGDTHAIHVSVSDDPRGYRIDTVLEGDTVERVLSYMQFDRNALVDAVRSALEQAHQQGRMAFDDGASFLEAYKGALRSYTYLDSA